MVFVGPGCLERDRGRFNGGLKFVGVATMPAESTATARPSVRSRQCEREIPRRRSMPLHDWAKCQKAILKTVGVLFAVNSPMTSRQRLDGCWEPLGINRIDADFAR